MWLPTRELIRTLNFRMLHDQFRNYNKTGGCRRPFLRRMVEEGCPQDLFEQHGYFFQMMTAQSRGPELRVQ
jgi:hypothetical protein